LVAQADDGLQHYRGGARPAPAGIAGHPEDVRPLHDFALQCTTIAANGMETQLTVRLPEALSRKLELSARRLKRKRSDVVRLALEQFLDVEPDIRPIERVRDLIGRIESGVPDLGQRHREHLIRRLRRGE
jgi:predicted DNA-binding protein